VSANVRLGLNLGYWGAGNDAANLALVQEADQLGYAVAWMEESVGSDAATVLSWIAGADLPHRHRAAPADPRWCGQATSLLGRKERITERMTAFAEAGVTTLTVAPYLPEPSQSSTAPRSAVDASEPAGVA
jgi:alkanesulfonate monooxygenase SsuD/methylene tetrahydromethanopterin reductase-like flavin-dependent oxidoreductase (luciferase family)